MPTSPTPPHEPARNSRLAAVALVATLIGLGGGYFLWGSPKGASVVGLSEQACMDLASQRLQASGFLPPQLEGESGEVRLISGTVTEVSGNVVVIETANLERDPFAAPTPLTRRITVASDTTVTILTERDPQVVAQERLAFEAEFQEAASDPERAGQLPTPPSPFMEKIGTIADLRPGMTATIEAATNILRAESFTATTISVIQPFFTQPPLPPTEEITPTEFEPGV